MNNIIWFPANFQKYKFNIIIQININYIAYPIISIIKCIMYRKNEKWKWMSLSCIWLFVSPWTIHGILQAKILEWVVVPFSSGSSQPRDRTQVSHIAGISLPAEPLGKTYRKKEEKQMYLFSVLNFFAIFLVINKLSFKTVFSQDIQMARRHIRRCSKSSIISSVQLSSVTQSCPTLSDPMNCSTPGIPDHHQLPEFTRTHVHQVGDAIQPSHPLSSPSPPAPNPSQHQSLFQWVNICIKWPKYWSFSFSISPSSEYSGLISFRIDWFDLLTVHGTLKAKLCLALFF